MTRELEPKDFFPPERERRSESRQTPEVRRVVQLLPCQASKNWKFITAEVIDCSLHGLGLLVPEPMTVGQQFLAKLRTSKRLQLLLYTVQQSAPAPAARGQFRIGAHFSGFAAQELDEDLEKVLNALLREG